MTYRQFLSRTRIRPDISTAVTCHKLIFKELKKDPPTPRRGLVSSLMSMWCRHSSMATKYHRRLADWILEDCEKALQK
jgi:hypothetical protein